MKNWVLLEDNLEIQRSNLFNVAVNGLKRIARVREILEEEKECSVCRDVDYAINLDTSLPVLTSYIDNVENYYFGEGRISLSFYNDSSMC